MKSWSFISTHLRFNVPFPYDYDFHVHKTDKLDFYIFLPEVQILGGQETENGKDGTSSS